MITSLDGGPYAGVVSGIRSALDDGAIKPTIRVYSLQGESKTSTEDVLRSIRQDSSTPVIAIGSVAAIAALKTPADSPLIACMVADSSDLRTAENTTGVLLEFPLETQLKWIQRFTPKSRSIGVLYNPEENRVRIEKAREIAQDLGLTLVAQEVRRPQDLPHALSTVARDVDLLWGVTDQTVLSRQTAEAILLFSFRQRMPFTGLSASWVKAGALYALDRDYEDLGAQCGEMALRVLKGRRAGSIPITTPRKVTYVLNLRTAEHLRLNLPLDLIEGAAQVFR